MSSLLFPADVHLLTESEHHCPIVIKTSSFSSIAKATKNEIQDFFIKRSDLFLPAKVGRTETATYAPEFRGDLRCWLTPKLCHDENLSSTLTIVKSLIQICKSFQTPLELNGDYSIQVTKYPGNGSRYVRHRDTFPDQSRIGKYRKLTLIYYLNEEYEGGQLRIFLDGLKGQFGKLDYFDIDPKLDTLVIFRSEFVEHEVLPSFKDRFAITVWASGFSAPGLTENVKNQKAHDYRESDQTWKFPLNVCSITPAETCNSQDKSIFVSIANFCDSEGPHTLHDLFSKALFPKRVFVGYVYQGNFADAGNNFLNSSNSEIDWLASNVRRLYIPCKDATGPCYARHLAGRLWRQEDYYLQIDSHMRFRPGWDEYLINLFHKIKIEQGGRPIITTYPPGYTLPNNVPEEIHPTVLIPWKFNDSGILRQRSVTITGSRGDTVIPYYKSPLWAAGFAFSSSSILLDTPYSPFLPYLFFGEEILMALRLFTTGYDFYAPGEAVIYHLYSRSHRNTIQSQISPAEMAEREESIHVVKSFLLWDVHSVSEEERKSLLELNVRYFGIGNSRSKEDFARDIGVDFSSQSIDKTRTWLDYIIPPLYTTTSVSFADEITIEEDSVGSFKREIFQLLQVDQKSEEYITSSNNALHSILSFLGNKEN